MLFQKETLYYGIAIKIYETQKLISFVREFLYARRFSIVKRIYRNDVKVLTR